MKPMIHSVKHFLGKTLTTITTGTTDVTTVITAVNNTAANVGSEVTEGNSVKAVYFEIWAIGSSSNQFFTSIIYKNQGGGAAATHTELADLFTYDNKKNVLWTSQGLASNDGIAGPYPMIKQWVKIPKSKQRFGLGDKLQLAISSRGDASIIVCGITIYKEYS